MTSTLHTAAEHGRRFLMWWGDELADLVPRRLKRWAARGGRRTVLALEEGRLVHYQERNGKLARRGEYAHPTPLPAGERSAAKRPGEGPSEVAPHVLPLTLPSPRRREESGVATCDRPPSQSEVDVGEPGPPLAAIAKRGPVGLRLPHAACLVRRLDLPAAARRDFAKILRVDLERSTPFKPDEVYFDSFLEEGTGRDGKLGVRQVVVKREIVDPVLQQLKARGVTIAFVDCWDEAGKTGLPVDLLASDEAAEAAGGRRLRPAAVLGLSAMVLASSAVAMGLNKYESALELLRVEAEGARAKALAVRRSLDEAEAALEEVAALRRLKAERPKVIAVIDELTRVLPDEAWVRYLKVEEDVVDATIVAPKTAELLPLLGRSPLFGAADLTAPVTYDQEGETERAAVRMRLSGPAREVGAAPAEGSQG